MKKKIALLLTLIVALSFVACSGETSSNNKDGRIDPSETSDNQNDTTETPETTVPEVPQIIEYAIGESFGTDSVECVVTEVRWVTAEDVETHPAAKKEALVGGGYRMKLDMEDMFPGYKFNGLSGVNSKSENFPYLVVTFTLQNVGKEIVEPTLSGYDFIPFGNVYVVYDDGYTFESREGFNMTLEVLGDATKYGRVFEVPAAVSENEDKPLKIKVTLPTSNGETEEFIVFVR